MMAGRGGGGGRGGRGGFQAAEGDWPCPNPGCSNVNFARRDKCNRCQTARPEGVGGAPKPAASLDFRGPPGLFQAGDWACNTCGNVNWERRNECNICKSSKPGMPGLDEKRDGAGGGFNERQERVASAKAEIAEDGYDDFGMKKKNVRASKAEREAAALARLHQSYSAIYRGADAEAPAARTLSRQAPPPSFDKIEKVSRPVSPPPASAPRDPKRRRSRSPERGRRDVKRSRSRDRQRRSPVRDRERGRDNDSAQRRRSRSRSRDRGNRDGRRR